MKLVRSFIKGKMNKSVDERLVPDGEYIDGLNVRVGSTETTDIGALENTKGNILLAELQYAGNPLSADAICIGAFEDGANDTIYWFVHDPSSSSPTGIYDAIVSYNVTNASFTYIVSFFIKCISSWNVYQNKIVIVAPYFTTTIPCDFKSPIFCSFIFVF